MLIFYQRPDKLVKCIAGIRNTSKEASASARGAAMMARIGNTSRTNFAADITNKVSDSQSIGPSTTESELDKLRMSRQQGSFSIIFVLVIHPVRGRVTPNTYGQMSVLVETSATMQGERALFNAGINTNYLDVMKMCLGIWSIGPGRNGSKMDIVFA